MKDSTLNLLSKLFKHVLLIAASMFIVTYVLIAFFRIRFPFEIALMEGGFMEHVRRIILGQNIYISPSLDFIPFLYTPLYPYLLAVIAKIFGLTFMPLRMFSFLISLANFYLIFLFVKKESKNIFAGFLAVCLFAATFRVSNLVFDMVKNDSLFLFFLLAGIYLLRFRESGKSYCFAGFLISLAFLTKQTALTIIPPLVLYPFIAKRKYAWLFVLSIAAVIIASTIFLDYISLGWYSYYVFHLASSLGIIKNRFSLFWREDFMLRLSIAFTMGAFYIFTQTLNPKNKKAIFYTLLAVGMIGGSWIAMMNNGTSANSLIPAYAFVSIIFGLAIDKSFHFIHSADPRTKRVMEIYIYFICILQFVFLSYNPITLIPKQKHLQANKIYLAKLTGLKGEVFNPWHGYLTYLAGKNASLHIYPLDDIIRKNRKGEVKKKLIQDIRQAIKNKRFSAIIVEECWIFQKDVEKYYTPADYVFEHGSALCPLADKINPIIYLPNK